MFCSDCGAPNRDGARFCRACGRALDAAPDLLSSSLQPPVMTVATAPGVVSYALFAERLVALFLDWLILTGAGILLGLCIAIVVPANANVDVTVQLVQLLSVLGVGIYYAGFESSRSQATPGKKQMKLKVTDEHGRRLSFGRALWRWIAKSLSLIPFGIGFLFPLFTSRKQALHDLLAGTVVVKRSEA